MPVKVILRRKNEWLNRVRAYKVFVDGVQVGKLSNDKVEEFEVSQVNHTIECKMDWCYSNKYDLTTANADILYLQVRNGLKGFWVMYILLIITFLLNFLLPNREELLGEYRNWIAIVGYGIPLLYFIYYLTIGRRKYLILEKDTTNVFDT